VQPLEQVDFRHTVRYQQPRVESLHKSGGMREAFGGRF